MTIHRHLIALTVGFLASACSDSTGVEPQDLEGTWNATSAVLTNPANTSQSVDLVSIGFSITLVIEADGSLTAVFEEGTITDTETGTLTVIGNEVTIVLDGDTSTGTISRTGDMLVVDLNTGVEWDFDDDGLDEPATAHLELVRTT